MPVQLRVAWGKGPVVQLTPETTSALANWLPLIRTGDPTEAGGLPAQAPLFVVLGPPKSARQAIAETGLLRQVLRHAEQAGIPAHLRYPYVLRHYWATQEVSRGITVDQLQAQGGWRDRRSAQAYFQQPPARGPWRRRSAWATERRQSTDAGVLDAVWAHRRRVARRRRLPGRKAGIGVWRGTS
jgi:hypothetical protein